MSADVTLTLAALAERLGGRLVGDPGLQVRRIRALEQAGAGEIAVITEPKYFARIDTLSAGALVIPERAAHTRSNVIVVADARKALVTLLRIFEPARTRTTGIHPRAVVAEDAALGEAVTIGPCAVIESGARLGDRVTIGANAFVGENVDIGDDTTIHPNVAIYAGTVIGRRVVVHSGTVIGSDGFGYLETEDGRREKMPQLGIVEIGDDVEIGANCGIDRATLEKTSIGRGTKIDNLVQIGHNTTIGEHCCIVGQAGVAGSVTIGNRAVLGGQVGVSDHVTIGDGVVFAAQTGVHSDVHSGIWLGSPAMPYEKARRVFAASQRLPEYRERLMALEDAFAALQKQVQELAELELEPSIAPTTSLRGNGSGYGTEPADET